MALPTLSNNRLSPVAMFLAIAGVIQVLPSVPFPLMIFTLVVVYSAWFRRFGDRHPSLRNILAADPPSGIGVAFHRE